MMQRKARDLDKDDNDADSSEKESAEEESSAGEAEKKGVSTSNPFALLSTE